MSGPRKIYSLGGYSGLVSQARSRVTGTMVGVYAADQAGIESDPETPWCTVCEDHGTLVCHETLMRAREHAPDPTNWCEECREKEGRTESMKDEKDLAVPSGLSADGHKAHAAILAVLRKYDATDTGGCKAFYSPAEWRERGEEYGTKSELIVVYDGGSLRPFFNLDECCYNLNEEMCAALRAIGLFVEECTCWYAAVYTQ